MWTTEDLFDTWTGRLLPGFRVYAEYNEEKGGPVFRRFIKQPGKIFSTPEGKKFLEWIKGLGEEVDPLVPWLAKQFKSGSISLVDGIEIGDDGVAYIRGRDGELRRYPYSTIFNTPYSTIFDTSEDHTAVAAPDVRRWANWFNAKDHPLRKGVNIQDPSFGVKEMREVSKEHEESVAEEARVEEMREEYGDEALDDTIDYTFDNGYTVRKIDNDEAAKREGNMMGHCFSDYDDYIYPRAVEAGIIEAFSLRDPEGWPHATWHYNSDGTLAQVLGVDGHQLNSKYQEMFDEWTDARNKPSNPSGDDDYNSQLDPEEEVREEEVSRYEEDISDFDTFETFMGMSDSQAQGWLNESYQYYIEAINENPEDGVVYVADNWVDIGIRIDMRWIVSDFVGQHLVSSSGRKMDEAKVLWGTDSVDEMTGTPRQQRLDVGEAQGWNNAQYTDGMPEYQKDYMQQSENGSVKKEMTNLEQLFESAMSEGEIAGIDIPETINEFHQYLYDYKPSNSTEKEAWGEAVEILDEMRGNYTPMGQDKPTWDDPDATLENQMRGPTVAPPLWAEQNTETGQMSTPSKGDYWQGRGELSGKPGTKAVPWWAGYEEAYGENEEYPQDDDRLESEGYNPSKGSQKPNIFARSSVNDDYPWDTWTGKKVSGRRTGAVDGAGPNLRRLLKQPGKKLQTPEGEKFLQLLADQGEDLDPIAPWLANQFKKGEIEYNVPDSRYPMDSTGGQVNESKLSGIAQWYNAREHPTRQGVNVEQTSYPDVIQAVLDHRRAMREEAQHQENLERMKDSTAPVVHTFDNGYTVNSLTDPEHLEEESCILGHCMGRDGLHGDKYKGLLANDQIEAYSLRGPDGIPHATWHYNSDGTLAEAIGRSGGPNGEYQEMIDEWAELTNHPTEMTGETEELEDDHLAEYRVPIEDVTKFFALEDGTYTEMAYEDYDANIGENTVIYPDVDRDSIFKDLLRNGPVEFSGYNRDKPQWDKLWEAMKNDSPTAWNEILDNAEADGILSKPEYGSTDPIEGTPTWGPQVKEWWDGIKNEYTDPYGESGSPDFSDVWGLDGTPLQKWRNENMQPLWTPTQDTLEGEADVTRERYIPYSEQQQMVERGEMEPGGKSFRESPEREQIMRAIDRNVPWWSDDPDAGRIPEGSLPDANDPRGYVTEQELKDRARTQDVHEYKGNPGYGGGVSIAPDQREDELWFGLRQ